MPRAWDPPPRTWVNRIFTSKSGELALELGKDLGIFCCCLISALALEDPEAFRETQPISTPTPHLLMVGSRTLQREFWVGGMSHCAFDSLL